MKRWLVISWFIGLALVTLLIISQGITVIQGVFTLVGGQIFWLAGFYLVPLSCAALSWFYLFPPQRQPASWLVIYTTWISLAINWLLPVAQVGGEIVKTRILIKQGYSFSATAASTLGDQTLQIATQALYALLGFGLFLYHWQDLQLIIAILGGIVYLRGCSKITSWFSLEYIVNILVRVRIHEHYHRPQPPSMSMSVVPTGRSSP